jgi:hypothetical protein
LKSNYENIEALRFKALQEIFFLSLLGPLGMVRLATKHSADMWQLAGMLCVWIAFFWCRWITGISVSSILYEIFSIGCLLSANFIHDPVESECSNTKIFVSELLGTIAGLLAIFSFAFFGYVELLLARHIKNFFSPIDLLVISIGFFGYGIMSYRALKMKIALYDL